MAQNPPRHGGNLHQAARRLGCRPQQLLDFSASLVPFGPPARLRGVLRRALSGGPAAALVAYPDRSYCELREVIALHHGIDASAVLPGNGAAELFTWAARDAAGLGVNTLLAPGFVDYQRALACWHGRWRSQLLQLPHREAGPQALVEALAEPLPPLPGPLWITNPHNPTGQLWSRESLLQLLEQVPLLVVDEAFLPLLPHGEQQSLLPLAAQHPRLVVIRSLTKLCAIAGVRLGYAVATPQRLHQWAQWRDPWPVNGLAAAAGIALITDHSWQRRVHRWLGEEGPRLQQALGRRPGLQVGPTAANYLLISSEQSLQPLRLELEQRHRILLRDCRSFEGLNECWLRLAVLDRGRNQQLLRALDQALTLDRA